jgi:predicted transcriptional regulator
MQAVKDAMLEMARALPPEATWDDVMDRIYVRQKIEDGIRDADEGRTTPHDEIFEEFADDADPLD